ncbi:MAG: hypothetical protein ISR77_25745 [Pirellulaceae bacterium]|nr:hypothetical protein [Pirellulaceae bacterium]
MKKLLSVGLSVGLLYQPPLSALVAVAPAAHQGPEIVDDSTQSIQQTIASSKAQAAATSSYQAPISHRVGMMAAKSNPKRTYEIGAGWLRLQIVREFDDYRQNPDNYDWSTFDEQIDGLAGRILMATFRTYSGEKHGNVTYFVSDTAAGRAQRDIFLDFIRKMARRYKGKILYYQLGNELNLGFQWPTDKRDQLGDLFMKFAAAVKGPNQDPGAKTTIGGLGLGDGYAKKSFNIRKETYLEILKPVADAAKADVDVLDVHFHSNWKDADILPERIGQFRKILSEVGLQNKPVVFTENSTWIGTDNANQDRAEFPLQQPWQQASFLLRSIYLGLALGNVDSVTVGDSSDKSLSSGKNWRPIVNSVFYNSRTQYNLGAPMSGAKPAALIARLAAELTQESVPADFSIVANPPADTKIVRVSGSNPHIVIWSTRSGVSERTVAITDVTGEWDVLEPIVDTLAQWPLQDPIAMAQSGTTTAANGEIKVKLKYRRPVIFVKKTVSVR